MELSRIPAVAYVRRHIHSLISLTVRGLSVVAGFAVTLLIGRMFGPEANGHYAIVTQTAMFLSVVAVGGIDLAVTRTFSAAAARKIQIELLSFLKVVGYSAAFSAILMIGVLLGGHRLMMLLFNGPAPRGTITVLILIMMARTLTRMLGAVLRSQRAYALGQSVEVLLIPTLVLVLVGAGFARDVEGILWMTAWVGVGVGVVAFLSSLRYTSTSADALHVPMRQVLKIAAPLWGVAIFLNVSEWYGLATTSAILGVHDAGLYRVAAQVAGALNIITLGLFSVYSPQFGAAASERDMAKVARLAGTASRLAITFSLPAAIVIFVLAGPLLQLLGEEFLRAEGILRIAVVGQAIFTITGPSGLVLAMTGNERSNLLVTIVSTGTLLAAAPIAAHFGGLTGIVLCMSLLMIGRNLASMWFVRRRTGINVLTGGWNPPPDQAAAR